MCTRTEITGTWYIRPVLDIGLRALKDSCQYICWRPKTNIYCNQSILKWRLSELEIAWILLIRPSLVWTLRWLHPYMYMYVGWVQTYAASSLGAGFPHRKQFISTSECLNSMFHLNKIGISRRKAVSGQRDYMHDQTANKMERGAGNLPPRTWWTSHLKEAHPPASAEIATSNWPSLRLSISKDNQA